METFVNMFFFRFFLVLFPLFLISNTSHANCPPLNQVTYGCSVVEGKKHCNWRAPWYEGFIEPEETPGERAKSFIRVFWGSTHSQPKPSDIGSTICFYESQHGDTIELVQNVWGGVKYPKEIGWVAGQWEGRVGRECGHGLSPSQCKFAYP